MYFRCAGVIESWQVERLLWRLGVAEALPPLRELIEQACERPFERAARGPNLGVSVAFTSGGTVAAFSLFGYARRLLGADAVARRRVLAVATAHGWDFRRYERVSAPLADRVSAPAGHGVVAFVVDAPGRTALPGDAVPARGRRMSASSIRAAARATSSTGSSPCNQTDGAFPATIHMPTGRLIPDRNCFVTAQVLRALTPATLPAERRVAVGRALAFLERSGSTERPGSWGFWPRGEGLRPGLNYPEPPLDCDDTAIVALELARWGRIEPPAAIRIAAGVLLSERLVAVDWPAPPWFGEGVFVTWMEDDGRPQVIDCAVNANVAALFAHLGLGAARLFGGMRDDRARRYLGGRFGGSGANPGAVLPGAIGELARAIEHAGPPRRWGNCGPPSNGRDPPPGRHRSRDAPVCSSMYGACRSTSPTRSRSPARSRRTSALSALTGTASDRFLHIDGCSPLHCIVPPHMLEAIEVRGDEEQHQAATLIAEQAAVYRAERLALAPEAGLLIAPLMAAAPTGPKREIYDAAGGTDLPGKLVRSEGDDPTGETAVDEAYDGSGDTYSFFAEQYGRDSLDGVGLTLQSSVHVGKGLDNAYWNGRRIAYGDGGMIFKGLTGSLAVIGHELSHGVVQFSGGLVYRDQAGALNESLADVFGSLVVQRKLGQSAAEASWLIEQQPPPGRRHGRGAPQPEGAGDGVRRRRPRDRSTAVPHGRLRDHDRRQGRRPIDSGIPNHAFYLLAQYLGGNAYEKAGQIWYDSLQAINNPHATFADWAAQTVAKARDRFGAGSREELFTARAWRLVGVEFAA